MIYLDNAATTKPCSEAVNAMVNAAEMFGNPSSLYRLGLESEKKINEVRAVIAGMLGTASKNIFFTSGGTEANNMIIFGAAEAKKKLGMQLITTQIEHPSVLEAFKRLETMGYDVTYLRPDRSGRISIDELKRAVTAKTTLISVMHVNNETGVIQPVEQIRSAVKDIAPNALIHSDCVQSFGKIGVKKLDVDFISISAHKIHGYKGTGAAYIGDTRNIRPIIYGGEQQNGIRPGTENVGGIMAFGAAAAATAADSDAMRGLREYFKSSLTDKIDNIVFNGSDEYNSGSVLNVSFLGIKAEILLHSLEARGVYVSTGSACSSHKPQPSHVLTSMGCTREEISGAVRFSFDASTTREELLEAAKITAEETAAIRRFMR